MLWVFECLEIFRCSISSVSIYYAPESDLRVKSYDHFNFSRAFVVQFRSSLYISGLNRTPELKVMSFEYAESFLVQIQSSRYIIFLNRTSGSKVLPVWIWLVIPYLISSVLIYYKPESDIRVKCFDHLNLLRTFVAQFRASRYIMDLNHRPESKVMTVWNCRELSCSNSSVLIYGWPESDIQVQSYGHLNFPCASMFNFEHLDIL